MTITFPNQSRSYDVTRRAVRFWGHDGAMESSFFVDDNALVRLQPSAQRVEADILNAFDLHRPAIYKAAAKVYGRGRKGSYVLSSDDF